jgi:predicted Zn-dependent protease
LSIRQVNPEEHNHNVSDVNHVKEVIILVLSIFAILIALYWSSIFALDSIVERLSPEREAQLMKYIGSSKKLNPLISDKKEENVEPRLQRARQLLNELLQISDFKNRSFEVVVIPGKDINAFAVPGDTILLVDELLEKVESENELAMVLGHELGHFHYRHHLKGMGRRLVMGFFSMMIFGDDNPISKLFLGGLDYTDRKFNQVQESDCDLYGAGLVFKKHGHLAGGLAFFEKLDEKEGIMEKYFSTHPLSVERVDRISIYAQENNWPLTGELIPLAPRKGSASDSP